MAVCQLKSPSGIPASAAASASADVLGVFDDLHRAGRTVVLITHEAEIAERAERIIRIRDGLIATDLAGAGAAAP